MKKIISVILLLTVCLTSFASCDGDETSSQIQSGDSTVNSAVSNVSNTVVSHLTPEDVSELLNSTISVPDAPIVEDERLNIPEDDYIIPPQTNPANLYYFTNIVPDNLADAYCKIVAAIANCKMTCQLDAPITAEELELLFICISADNPQFFHIYSGEQPNHFSFSPNDNSVVYIMYEFKKENSAPDIDLIKSYQAKIQEEIAEPIAEAKKYESVFDQMTYLYYWLVDGTEISWSKYNEHPHCTIKEVLLDKHGVCIGYALSLSYLYRQLGITTTTGMGVNSSNVEHTWCIPYVDGVYYACDGYFANEHRVNFEHSSAEFLFMTDYEKEKEMQVEPYKIYKGPTLG